MSVRRPSQAPARVATDIPPSANPARGIAVMIVSTVAFACMHAAIRHVSADLHAFEIAFFRNLFGIIVIVPWFARHGLALFKTRRIGLLSLRAVINAGAMLAFFYALGIQPLAQVTALSFTAPIFATLLAMLILGERVRLRRWMAMLIGFVGVLVIIRPGSDAVGFGTFLVLGAALAWAFALIVIKELTKTESPITITAYMVLFISPLSLVPALFVWTAPTPIQLAWLALIGILGTVAQLLLAQSLKDADATLVMPFDFLKLIWTSLLGYLLFQEVPGTALWTGAALIFSAATYIAFREAALARQGRV